MKHIIAVVLVAAWIVADIETASTPTTLELCLANCEQLRTQLTLRCNKTVLENRQPDTKCLRKIHSLILDGLYIDESVLELKSLRYLSTNKFDLPGNLSLLHRIEPLKYFKVTFPDIDKMYLIFNDSKLFWNDDYNHSLRVVEYRTAVLDIYRHYHCLTSGSDTRADQTVKEIYVGLNQCNRYNASTPSLDGDSEDLNDIKCFNYFEGSGEDIVPFHIRLLEDYHNVRLLSIYLQQSRIFLEQIRDIFDAHRSIDIVQVVRPNISLDIFYRLTNTFDYVSIQF